MDEIIKKDSRYKPEAYNFLMEALNYTVNKLPSPRHVTGEELLNGIKKYAIEQFGPMVRTVFEHWGITKTDDFGEIVFNLVRAKILSKRDSDSKDDFKGVYDFKKVFGD